MSLEGASHRRASRSASSAVACAGLVALVLAAGGFAVHARTPIRMEPLWGPWVDVWEERAGPDDGGPARVRFETLRTGVVQIGEPGVDVRANLFLHKGRLHAICRRGAGFDSVLVLERDEVGGVVVQVAHTLMWPRGRSPRNYPRQAVRVGGSLLP